MCIAYQSLICNKDSGRTCPCHLPGRSAWLEEPHHTTGTVKRSSRDEGIKYSMLFRVNLRCRLAFMCRTLCKCSFDVPQYIFSNTVTHPSTSKRGRCVVPFRFELSAADGELAFRIKFAPRHYRTPIIPEWNVQATRATNPQSSLKCRSLALPWLGSRNTQSR